MCVSLCRCLSMITLEKIGICTCIWNYFEFDSNKSRHVLCYSYISGKIFIETV